MELAIVIIIIVTIIAVKLVGQSEQGTERTSEKHSQNDWLSENGYQANIDYKFQNVFNYISARYIIDIQNRCIGVTQNNRNSFDILPFSDINGVEVIEDNEVTDSVSRAIAGGITFGNVGAVVGAMTSQNFVINYKVIIYTTNIANSRLELLLIKNQTLKSDIDYRRASDFANRVNASIRAILTNLDTPSDILLEKMYGSSMSVRKIIEDCTENDVIMKLKAISQLRNVTNLGLAEAKEIIDQACDDENYNYYI